MDEKSDSSIYIGNLDERVTDRMLYDILMEAGRVVDLHIPRDRETDKPKGFAFAEYESADIAIYAVNLFSGLVTLYNRSLKFAISGQDKSATTPMVKSSIRPRPFHSPHYNTDFSSQSPRFSSSCRFSENSINHLQVPVSSDVPMHQSNGYRSLHGGSIDNNYSRRVFGDVLDSISRSSSSARGDRRNSMNYNPFY